MCVADRAISLHFGALYRTVEDDIARYVTAAYRGRPERPLSAGSIVRQVAKAVGVEGFYIRPEQLVEWVDVFEERTGRKILEAVPDTRLPTYRCVYHLGIRSM
jgi:hypothetical protein